MANSQIIVYFKKTPLLTFIFLYFASIFNIYGIKKTRFEKNRVILTTDVDKNTKIRNLRKFFKFYNLLNIEKIETNF